MEPLLSRVFTQLAPRASRAHAGTRSTWSCRVLPSNLRSSPRKEFRSLSTTRPLAIKEKKPFEVYGLQDNSYAKPAADLSQNVSDAEQSHFDRVEKESKEKQVRSPWMREGSEKPPVARQRSAGAMTKGKLLTTPSRMLKLILPLTTRDANKDRKDVEPLALLVHPQQPLSYLERLIQSELPVLVEDGKERIPKITFRAEDSSEEDIMSGTPAVDQADEQYDLEEADEMRIGDKVEKTGKLKSEKEKQEEANLPVHGHAQNQRPEDPNHPNFVRWSPSTEIGDFIRDAARGKEFAVDVEGAPPVYVGVPSFDDRTYYLRTRLRKTSRRILQLADIKKECDNLAQKGAQRVAQGGFMGLVGWWGAVYYLTFKTDLGWDVMEPVTYLVGLSGLIGGYMWFLYHNREVSYRSAMNFTVSRRQSQLYDAKGFNLQQWEGLVEEGNRLRREIKMVADEYDVEWDESKDEGDERVSEALREERKKKKDEDGDDDKKDKKKKDDDDD